MKRPIGLGQDASSDLNYDDFSGGSDFLAKQIGHSQPSGQEGMIVARRSIHAWILVMSLIQAARFSLVSQATGDRQLIWSTGEPNQILRRRQPIIA
jgi:hypothetical protein